MATPPIAAGPDFSDAAKFGLTVSTTPPSAPAANFSDAAKFGLQLSATPPAAPRADFSDAAKFGLKLLPARPQLAPGSLPPPIPRALGGQGVDNRTPEERRFDEAVGFRTNPSFSPSAGQTGATEALNGAAQMTEPGAPEKLRGAGKIALGVMDVLSPELMMLGATAPLDAAAWYAGSKALEKTTELGGLASGMKPADAKELGQVAALAPIAAGGFRIAQDRLADAIDAHNAQAAKLVAEDAVRGEGADLGAQIVGDEMPVGTEGWKVIASSASKQGRPNYSVLDASGKTIFGGNGREVQQFLESKGVKRTPAQQQAPAPPPEPAPIVEEAAPAPVATPAAAQPSTLENARFPDKTLTLADRQARALDYVRRNPKLKATTLMRRFGLSAEDEIRIRAQAAAENAAPPQETGPLAGLAEEAAASPTKGAEATPAPVSAPDFSDAAEHGLTVSATPAAAPEPKQPAWFTPKEVSSEDQTPAIREENGATVVRAVRWQKTPGAPEVNPDGATYFSIANAAGLGSENAYAGEMRHWGGRERIAGEVRFEHPLVVAHAPHPTFNGGANAYGTPLPELVIDQLAGPQLAAMWAKHLGMEVARHKSGRPPSGAFLEREHTVEEALGIPEGTIDKARGGPPGAVENAVAAAMLRARGYDGAIAKPASENDLAEAMRLSPAKKPAAPQVTEAPEGTKYVLPKFVTQQYAKGETEEQAPAAAPTPEAAPQPETWTEETPAPAPGLVRLYRGEHPTRRFSEIFNPDILPESIKNSGKSGGWWTSDRNYAEYFRDSMGPGAQIRYIDVPAELAQAHAIEKSPDLLKDREYERGYVYFFPELSQATPPASNEAEEAQGAEPEEDEEIQPVEALTYRRKGNHKIDVRLWNDAGTWRAEADYNLQGQMGGGGSGEGATREEALTDATRPMRRHLAQFAENPGSTAKKKTVAEAKRMVAWIDQQTAAKPGTIETDAARRSHPEPLEGVPAENRESPGGEGPASASGGESGGTARGDLQPDEGEGIRTRSGGRSGARGVDRAGEARESDTAGAGDVTRETEGHDFRITAETQVGEGTPRQKLDTNLEAIRIVKRIEAEERLATPDEQQKLARYVGWGSLSQVFERHRREFAGAREELESLLTPEEYKAAEASTVNAHYTSPAVIRAMWEAMRHLGLQSGASVLEPSLGIGNFFGLQPESLLPARRTGVELDKITGAIAKALYPDSNVQVTGFEKIALPPDFFDVAISNVPFGNYGVHDPRYRKTPIATRSIHNYFFVKSLDLVRPGGIVAFITSRYTMDAQDPALRELLHDKADLLGMIRLPDTAFKANAGTKVVTDVIFFQKRAEGQAPAGPAFLETAEVPTEDAGKATVNEYYAAHPEMMLGKLTLQGSMYHGRGEQTLKGQLTPETLAEALKKLPGDIYGEWKAETPAFETAGYAQLGDEVKDGGYALKDGVVVQRDGDIYRSVPKLGKTQEARIRAMIPVRGAVRQVFVTQLEEATGKEIAAARAHLNKAYDFFVKKFGPFSSAANSRALGEDPDYTLLAALETSYDKQTGKAEKAAIFRERTIPPRASVPAKVERASEALAITLNERGRLDWDRMQQLTGKTPDEVREELGGLVFQNPIGRKWETDDEYLSGNVRQKLEEARAAAAAEPQFDANLRALEQVQPRDLLPQEIKATLGAPWIPPHMVADFLRKVLDLDGAVARYVPEISAWSITVPKWARDRTANTATYGTPDFDAHELVDLALSGKNPRVYIGPRDKRVLDPTATATAQAAMDALKEKFKEWIWDQSYAGDLAAKYNREMNNLRLAEHNASHLTLPGSNPAITLRAHQKAAIWRALKTGNTLLAHEVGAGKTWEMVGIAMESRRLGLARKPMLVVPNHMAEQVSIEFRQLYPAARILTIGRDDFAADRRKRAIARIATGTWDAVIMRHSSFEKIPVSDDTYQSFVDEQIEELKAALDQQEHEIGRGAEKDKTVKELQKAIKRLEVKLEKRLKREKKDNGATFEELGVDLLLVDEAHAFKALPIITRRTRIAGIPQRESDRATDMFMKTQYVSRLSGGKRGVIFATGTPVTNTMAELYNMQRYLQLPALKAAGLAHFDAWANTFGEILRGVELDVSGKGFRENERFAKFINIPELMMMYRQIADVKTAEMMNLPRPEVEGGGPKAIAAPETPELTKFVEHLVGRAERIRSGAVDKRVDNMLKVVGEGKKAALDMRLVMPNAPDRPDSKVNKAVRNIFDIWKETRGEHGTQLVFCDLSTPKKAKKAKVVAMKPTGADEWSPDVEGLTPQLPEAAGERAGFSVYNDIRDKLVRAGVPANEIAFIHDYSSDEAKQELFDAVNAGKVRILMGSTEKMGIGTNVQRRAIALHHLDAPWRPADIKQRDGRIVRQGNSNPVVRLFQYLTEGSFDAYMWQLLETKAKFIAPVLSGELSVREMEDIGMVLPSAAEFKAIASGDPIIKEKIGTDGALARLDAQRNGFRRQQAGIKSQLAALPGKIDSARRIVGEISADVRVLDAHKDAGYTVGKTQFSGEDARKHAAEALDKTLNSWRGPGSPQKIGSYRGLDLWTAPGYLPDSYPGVTLRGKHSYAANPNPDNPLGTLQSIENVVRSIPSRVEPWQRDLDEGTKKQRELEAQQGKQWPKEAEYQALVKKKAEIDAKLAQSEAEKAAGAEENERGGSDYEKIGEGLEKLRDESDEEEEPESEAPEKPPAPKNPGSGSVYLGSGFGAMQPYFEKFFAEDVAPTAKHVAEMTRAAWDDLLKLLAPAARGPQAKATGLSVRMRASELQRSTDRAEAALHLASKFFQARSAQENYDFIDRVESGSAQPTRDLQRIADLMRLMLDSRRDQIQDLGTGKLEQFIEDYFPHVWEQPEQARKAFQNAGKRPLPGSQAFLRKRTIETFADGIELGLKPISDDPTVLVRAKCREMDKYLMAHRILGDVNAHGMLRFNRATKPLPEGYAKIEDRVATVWGTPSHPGAQQIEGYYIVPEPAAHVLNNYLSPGLREKYALFRGYLGLANLMNQAQLGFSGFHMAFTAFDTASSKLALGIYQGAHGDILKGIKSAMITPVAPFTTLMRGSKMLKEWYGPGTQGALIGELIDAAIAAGGRPRMDAFYTTHFSDRLLRAWHAGNVFGAMLRAPGAAMEQAARPIMEYLVPRFKMGVFADLAQYELERAGTNATDPDVQAALARAWDSVDNRLGQLVYDNLFWNKSVKDLAMASVRSVGWNVGTIREIVGGAADAAKLVGGKGGFTPRMSYIPAFVFVSGLLGAVLYYLWHGHGPQHLVDYFFPTDSHGRRWSLPTYMKDVYHWAHNPVGTAESKIHPALQAAVEMLENRDFYDKPIMNPHHSLVKRAEDLAKFAIEQFTPISVRAGSRGRHPHRQSIEDKVLPYFGIVPAPKYIGKPSR